MHANQDSIDCDDNAQDDYQHKTDFYQYFICRIDVTVVRQRLCGIRMYRRKQVFSPVGSGKIRMTAVHGLFLAEHQAQSMGVAPYRFEGVWRYGVYKECISLRVCAP